jgi:hypothetical protein
VRVGFAQTLLQCIAVDFLIAGARWFSGRSEGEVILGFVAGVIGSLVLAAILSTH